MGRPNDSYKTRDLDQSACALPHSPPPRDRFTVCLPFAACPAYVANNASHLLIELLLPSAPYKLFNHTFVALAARYSALSGVSILNRLWSRRLYRFVPGLLDIDSQYCYRKRRER